MKAEIKMKRCRYCLATENLTVDHKIPLIQGGINDVKNLQCLCKNCNTIKSGMSHKQVKSIGRWTAWCDRQRIAKGKKPIFYSLN